MYNVVHNIILHNMTTKITSSYLKQNTREVLNEVVNKPNNDLLIFTYNEPRAVVISYDRWEKYLKGKGEVKKVDKNATKIKPKTMHDKWKKYIQDGPAIDSTALIREMRDDE